MALNIFQFDDYDVDDDVKLCLHVLSYRLDHYWVLTQPFEFSLRTVKS